MVKGNYLFFLLLVCSAVVTLRQSCSVQSHLHAG
jgi:hypothetical protein